MNLRKSYYGYHSNGDIDIEHSVGNLEIPFDEYVCNVIRELQSMGYEVKKLNNTSAITYSFLSFTFLNDSVKHSLRLEVII